MNKKKKYPTMVSSFRVLSFIFAAILISACSKRVAFPTSEVLPAADAVAKVDKNDNNNYEVELKVRNMARPERLNPPRRTYVAWMVTESNGTINIGNLRISSKLRSTLETVTPYKPIRFLITAEETQSVISPSTQVVLTSEEFEID